VPLAVAFLTNAKLSFLNHEACSVDRRLLKQLQEGAPLTTADLDAAAFLALHDLRAPKYAADLEQFMAETMQAADDDEPERPLEAVAQHNLSFHRGPLQLGVEADYYRTSALGRHADLFAGALPRASAADPFASAPQQRLARVPDFADLRGQTASQLSALVYVPDSASFRSSSANSKLQELNKSYQQYISYLQGQAASRQQAEAEAEAEQQAVDEAEADSEEQPIALTPAAYYESLLSLRVSTSSQRVKADALMAKIVRIQACARGLLVRRRLLLKWVFDKAATLVQAAFRGHRVRARMAAALKQLHKSVAEELRRAAQDEATGSGKASKEEVPTVSPIEAKLQALEEENRKMREKLDQQNELMLSLLASQNISQLNVSNRLLAELKTDISTLKERSLLGQPTQEKPKKSSKTRKEKSPKQDKSKAKQQQAIKPTPKDQDRPAEVKVEVPLAVEEVPAKQAEDPIVEEVVQAVVEEDGVVNEEGGEEALEEQHRIEDAIKEEPEEQLEDDDEPKVETKAEETEIEVKNEENAENGGEEEQNEVKSQEDKEHSVKDHEVVVSEESMIKQIDDRSEDAEQKEPVEESPKKDNSDESGEEEGSEEESNAKDEKEDSDNEEEQEEQSESSSKRESEEENSESDQKNSNVSKEKGNKEKEFLLDFPLKLEQVIVNEDFTPQEDEFNAHLIDETSIVNKSEQNNELSSDRNQITSGRGASSHHNSRKNLYGDNRQGSNSGRYSATNSKSASGRSQPKAGVNNYSNTMLKSGSSSRLGTSYRPTSGLSDRKDKPSISQTSSHRPQPGNKGPTTAKSTTSTGGAKTGVQGNLNLSQSKGSKTTSNLASKGETTSPNPGASSVKNSSSTKPTTGSIKKPTSAGTTPSLRSMVGNLTKTGGSGLYGKR
jgi:hypothetical protein